MTTSTIVTIVALILTVIYLISIYNKLVALKNRFKNSFSQIEVQMKRRYDLIPNLIESAKGYLAHEKETLQNVVEARNHASDALKNAADNPIDAGSIKNLATAETTLGNAMGKFNLVMEAYPDLKANQNMMQLSEELITTENKVAFARQAYNDGIMDYNTYKQSFPQVILASIFKHGQDGTLLEFEDKEKIKQVPKVSF
jgi:LemA protein|tara:strand:- start:2779 stop:3375 length:597 start_codon:yes stop_codon:yes gene_type:complete